MTAGPCDVVVAGAGPTGLALAAALAERGLAVRVVDPAPDRPWVPTYAGWADELDADVLALPGTLTWPGAVVADDTGRRTLPRAYARPDTAALRAGLRGRAEAAGVRVVRGAVATAEHTGAGSTAVCRDGTRLPAALVVDATGHRPALVQRAASAGPAAVQAAYGVVADFAGPPAEPGRAVLMDYSTRHLPAAERGADPTFLYAFPLGGDRWFVEETSLARRPALPTAVLARRLAARLAAAGAPPGPALEVEHVRIPMDPPLPLAGQRVLGFGAAASAVHPATGYLVAAALRDAPGVAAAVAGALEAPGGGPAAAATAGWAAVWPAERVRARRLHAFGLAALLGMDAPTTAAFFRTFFAARPADWSGYLSGRLTPSGTVAAMARLYAAAPPGVRARLRGAALGPARRALLDAASGRLPPPR